MAQARQVAPAVWEDVDRVVVLGDVHGALGPVRQILQASGLIDTEDGWIGGRSHLVSLGDLIDRGAASRAVMDLFIALQPQAAAAGGRVHVILGNHEVMNLLGNLQDVSEAELASYGGVAGHARLFAQQGEYGRWLTTLPTLVKINNSLFVHGGLSRVASGRSVQQINADTQADISALLQAGPTAAAFLQQRATAEQNTTPLAPQDPSLNLLSLADQLSAFATQDLPSSLQEFIAAARAPLLDSQGPHWYRGNASCHPLLENQWLSGLLNQFQVSRVVIGHTPTPGRAIRMRLQQQVVAIDTGMLAEVYKGRPQALEITQSESGDEVLVVIDAAGERYAPQNADLRNQAYTPDRLALLRAAPISQLDASAQPTQVLLDTAAGEIATQFVPLSGKRARQAVAAYRLSELLQLDMVAPTVLRKIEGKSGVLRDSGAPLKSGRWLSEAQRQQGGYQRPNYCYAGSDYNLLSAFDSLIGKRDRNPDNLHYVIPTWAIRIDDNGTAFDTSKRVNRYPEIPALPRGFKQQLGALTHAQLTELLADLLSERQIKAILQRRDAILDWPTLSSAESE
ncbi:MAG: metallophosphoesterase [Pseudomonadota bacterium]